MKDGVLNYNNDNMRNIFEIWKKGADEGVFSIDTFTNKDAGRNNYKAGQVAMLFQSGSHAAEAAPTVGAENTTVIPEPGAAENGSYAFTAGILVPQASKVQDLAVQFIKEALMDKELQLKTAEEWGKLPVISDTFNDINAQWKDNLFAIIQKSASTPFYKGYPEIDQNVPILLQNYLMGKFDLDGLMKGLDELINRWRR